MAMFAAWCSMPPLPSSNLTVLILFLCVKLHVVLV
jgi:hypothetical protein